jgi:hypothetical protein
MGNSPVLGNGPIRVTDQSTGQFFLVPLSAFQYASGSSVPTGSGSLYQSHKTAIDAWLAELGLDGAIAPDTQPPPNMAITITAVRAGSMGNNVIVTFSAPHPDSTDPSKTVFDATLTEVDTYSQIGVGDLQAQLGTSATNGTKPGLVYMPGSNPAMPGNTPAPVQLNSKDGSNNYFAALMKADGTTEAFALNARGGSATDGSLTTVEVRNADDANHPNTFTLIVTWTKTVTVAPADLASTSKGLGYEITAAAADGGSLGYPLPGRVALRGGADGSSPAAATAMVAGNR